MSIELMVDKHILIVFFNLVRFMFAEINADRATWVVVPDKYHRNNPESAGYELVGLEKNAVGNLLCTKAVGTYELQDVTSQYKQVLGNNPIMWID